ncbi:MAG: hypothetical protein HY201_02310 [Nitrospirae bacterium]|nr:hypothetical protein [Candidatus Troglogloeales bacterium]MBI3598277.1 hypothetical protein [Candidatus Troglogloeales bacterium]
MFTKIQKRFGSIVVLGLFALAAFPSFLTATHSWGGYHWARTANPFTLKLGDNLTSTWDPFLVTTSSDWSLSTVLDTTIVAGGTTAQLCRATLGRVEVCNRKYGNNGWLGIAQIWVSGSHITQGTVKMNDTYFNTATYNTTPWRNLVMCQEVGHTLGLDHQDVDSTNPNLGTCMDYTNNPSGPPSNEHPNQHDYDELLLIYEHLDATTTLSQTAPAAMNQLSFDDRKSWGTKVRQSQDGLTALYELDFGGGNKVFTHVIWAY